MRMRRIEWFMQHPDEAQARLFDKLLARGSKTEFGKKHGLEDIQTQADDPPPSYLLYKSQKDILTNPPPNLNIIASGGTSALSYEASFTIWQG